MTSPNKDNHSAATNVQVISTVNSMVEKSISPLANNLVLSDSICENDQNKSDFGAYKQLIEMRSNQSSGYLQNESLQDPSRVSRPRDSISAQIIPDNPRCDSPVVFGRVSNHTGEKYQRTEIIENLECMTEPSCQDVHTDVTESPSQVTRSRWLCPNLIIRIN